MWRRNYRIQHKTKDLGFSIELHLLFFPTDGKESAITHRKFSTILNTGVQSDISA
jgi:hypothetical protein